MPRFDRAAICDLLRRLPKEDLEQALRHKIIRAVSLPGLALHVVCDHHALARARALHLGVIAHAASEDLLCAVHVVHGTTLRREATQGLARLWPELSASRRLTPGQAAVLLLLALMLGAMAALLPFAVVAVLLSLLAGIFFLGVIMLRLLCLLPPVSRPPPPEVKLLRDQLPAYSVLVPLFRETAVLGQLMEALRRLRYPPEKLDIKLILEEEDTVMQRAVAALHLPPEFEVIVVPAGMPQTKPRALNYALRFCRGELLTIYDAEDIPDRNQLLKAARRFAAAPPELACLQARLGFYNPDENWLTRQFTVEYATLFGMLLPVLADHRLPLPLGGTSNHFRTAVLRAVGGWDPFNVTEDADLGLRLARLGYHTGVLDSTTLEEANTRPANWMRQRARWLKGFLMTWLVHMRTPGRFLRDVGPSGFWTAQVMTLGVFASVLLHPLCVALTLGFGLFHPGLPRGAGFPLVLLGALNLLVFVAGYGVSILLARRALRKQGFTGWGGTLATMPLYWLLMSAAAWLALWQFATKPFHWNKTEHGISATRRVSRTRPRGTG